MKKVVLMATIAALFGVAGVFADEKAEKKEEGKELKAQATCPVMAGKIDKKHYVDTEEGRIYLCCPGCVAAVKKDPAKYIEKLKKEGVQLEKVPEHAEPEHHKAEKGGDKEETGHKHHNH